MDQLQEHLKAILKYRFWIILGLSVLLPLIGWATTIGGLDRRADRRAEEIDRHFDQVGQLRQGALPNERWKTETLNAKEELDRTVLTAWRQLYERQAESLEWPEEVKEKIEELGPDDPIPQDVRSVYRSIYPMERRKVVNTVRRYDPITRAGIVEMSPQLVRMESWRTHTPDDQEVRNAQEDLWVSGTILRAIARVNEGATARETAPVQAVSTFNIADDAGKVGFAFGPTSKHVRAPRPGGSAEDEESNRYVEQTKEFKAVPFEIAMEVRQSSVPDLLASFANSKIPIEIRLVQFGASGRKTSRPHQRAPVFTAARPQAPPAKEEDPTLTEVEIAGVVTLYRNPESKVSGLPAEGDESEVFGVGRQRLPNVSSHILKMLEEEEEAKRKAQQQKQEEQ